MDKTVKKTKNNKQKINEIAIKLKKIEKKNKNSIEYNRLYEDLYNAVINIGERYIKANADKLKLSGIRVDEFDYIDEVAIKGFIDVVKAYNPDKGGLFLHLYFSRMNQLSINYIKKIKSYKRKGLTFSDCPIASAKVGADKSYIYGFTKDKYDIDEKDNLFDLIDEFVKEDKRGKMFLEWDLYNTKDRTAHILKHLNSNEYKSKERKQVYDLKQKLKAFLVKNNYRLKYNTF